ncbi:MAG TPA: hypothetical protein VE954_29060 [Oligoflexus sp.]|uniref:hypothetical protein n=1 Tax=Oligoflexus sp. TaxID=1971216 RepID=UPI002D724650|nr:hypothetical protein [Oligoflexus sp.]HYX37172.1 hypothetical protein [Oligoflexus sp.]
MRDEVGNLINASDSLRIELLKKTFHTTSFKLARIQLSKALYECIVELDKVKDNIYRKDYWENVHTLIAECRKMLESAYQFSNTYE